LANHGLRFHAKSTWLITSQEKYIFYTNTNQI